MIKQIASPLRVTAAAAFISFIALCLSGPALADPTPAPPAPAPAPAATALPFFSIGGALTGGSFSTHGRNATGAFDVLTGFDRLSRTDVTNALVTPTFNSGYFHATATLGFYDLPTLGCALNPTTQSGANMTLFSAMPLYNVSYAPNSHVSFYAGKLLTQLGQEAMFTYQNFNVQRGLGWEMEPLVSRGVRGVYANGPWSVALEGNDGYYGGTSRAFEGSIEFAPTGTQTFSFAVIDPRANSAPNPTAMIANKREENLMYTGTFGKFVLTPYVLWMQSAAVPTRGYTDETAIAGSLLGTYNFTPRYSLGFRYEALRNASATNDPSANADLIGYGPGSAARTFTLTPSYKAGWGVMRFEWSSVDVTNLRPGLGFNVGGTGTHQSRYALEFGLAH